MQSSVKQTYSQASRAWLYEMVGLVYEMVGGRMIRQKSIMVATILSDLQIIPCFSAW